MTYSSIALCAADQAFLDRVTACVATEGYPMHPRPMAESIVWKIAAQDDIEQAYAYALDTGNPNPGGDNTVITDQMILSATQPLIPITPGPPPPLQNMND